MIFCDDVLAQTFFFTFGLMHLSTTVQCFDNDLWYYHIPIPAQVAQELSALPSGRRVLCTLNDAHTFPCALMPDGNGAYFINLSKAVRKKLSLERGDVVQVSLAPDESTYGMPMCDEFAEVLRQDGLGAELFHALSPGKQRSLIYYAGNVKSSEIRVRRALVIMEHLHIHTGKLDFKLLNAEMKEANARARLE